MNALEGPTSKFILFSPLCHTLQTVFCLLTFYHKPKALGKILQTQKDQYLGENRTVPVLSLFRAF